MGIDCNVIFIVNIYYVSYFMQAAFENLVYVKTSFDNLKVKMRKRNKVFTVRVSSNFINIEYMFLSPLAF